MFHVLRDCNNVLPTNFRFLRTQPTAFYQMADKAMEKTVWAGDCSSWYKNKVSELSVSHNSIHSVTCVRKNRMFVGRTMLQLHNAQTKGDFCTNCDVNVASIILGDVLFSLLIRITPPTNRPFPPFYSGRKSGQQSSFLVCAVLEPHKVKIWGMRPMCRWYNVCLSIIFH